MRFPVPVYKPSSLKASAWSGIRSVTWWNVLSDPSDARLHVLRQRVPSSFNKVAKLWTVKPLLVWWAETLSQQVRWRRRAIGNLGNVHACIMQVFPAGQVQIAAIT